MRPDGDGGLARIGPSSDTERLCRCGYGWRVVWLFAPADTYTSSPCSVSCGDGLEETARSADRGLKRLTVLTRSEEP